MKPLLVILCLVGTGVAMLGSQAINEVGRSNDSGERIYARTPALAAYVWLKHEDSDVDQAATLAMWQKDMAKMRAHPHQWNQTIVWRGDVNGDGKLDYLWNVGRYVTDSGIEDTNGVTGNMSWVLLVSEAGGFKLADQGFGLGPYFLHSTHHGWRDMSTSETFGGGEYATQYSIFDGKGYRKVWGGMGWLYEGSFVMNPSNFPDTLLRHIAESRVGHGVAKVIPGDDGWCYRNSMDDGWTYCLFWIDKLKLDHRTLILGHNGQPNLFLYAKPTQAPAGGWRRVFAVYHTGQIVQPWPVQSGFQIETYERGKSLDDPNTLVVTETVMKGKLVSKSPPHHPDATDYR